MRRMVRSSLEVDEMKKRNYKFFNKNGTEIVEFAITFPLFCVMVFGSVEIGWLLYQQSILDYGARQGARYASVDTATVLKPGVSSDISAQAKDVIVNAVKQFGGTAPSNFSVSWPSNGRTFALVVKEPYKPVAGKLIPIISEINTISTTVTMYCESCG